MKFTIEKNKELCERYPFLIPRNVWTGEVVEDYDYTFVDGLWCLPEGWHKLFLQMCEDIRRPLIDANYLDKFRFSEVKEKYGTMRCYNFGAPAEAERIISDYEHVSSLICSKCGGLATVETVSYILPFCDTCKPESKCAHPIKYDWIRRMLRADGQNFITEEYDCSYIRNKLFNGEE